MKPHGVAHIFGPGRADGPFPEHYEPLECPIPLRENPLGGAHRINPTARVITTTAKNKSTNARVSSHLSDRGNEAL